MRLFAKIEIFSSSVFQHTIIRPRIMFRSSRSDHQSMEEVPSAPDLQTATAPHTTTPKSWRFYLILISLSFIAFAASLDGSIIAIALPRITNDLSAKKDYIWIANSFLVAQTVIQPLCAQLCNIFGRRMPMLISICIFALGSGIAGGANASAMLIAGRTVQGLGSGGISKLELFHFFLSIHIPTRQFNCVFMCPISLRVYRL